MLTAQQYILAKIAEEATEVAQRAIKAQQFGLHQTEPGKAEDNAERLVDELMDLSFWVDVAEKNNLFAFTMDDVDFHRMDKLPVALDMFLKSLVEGQVARSGTMRF